MFNHLKNEIISYMNHIGHKDDEIDIYSQTLLEHIYNILFKFEEFDFSVINDNLSDFEYSTMCTYVALKYKNNNDIKNMKTYYLMSINKKCPYAMCNLGNYYEQLGDYDNALKYYHMAVNIGSTYGMNMLGNYYKKIKYYSQMLKYYHMAADKNDPIAMNNLGCYYADIEDYENMKKYYLMAIELKSSDAMCNLALYYKMQNDIFMMKRYLLRAIDNDNYHKAWYYMGQYYELINNYPIMIKYYTKAALFGSKKASDRLKSIELIDEDDC